MITYDTFDNKAATVNIHCSVNVDDIIADKKQKLINKSSNYCFHSVQLLLNR